MKRGPLKKSILLPLQLNPGGWTAPSTPQEFLRNSKGTRYSGKHPMILKSSCKTVSATPVVSLGNSLDLHSVFSEEAVKKFPGWSKIFFVNCKRKFKQFEDVSQYFFLICYVYQTSWSSCRHCIYFFHQYLFFHLCIFCQSVVILKDTCLKIIYYY